MPDVTAIIPVYNAAAYVARAVQTALEQEGVQEEILVVDDGSTDDTPQVLAAFGDRIRVIRQANAGHVRARNVGAQHARGQWLAFLDADDEWLPTKLSRQLATAQGGGPEMGLVYTNCENFGEISRVQSIQSEGVTLWDGDLFEKLLFGNFLTFSSVLIRRDWFERLGGFDEAIYFCPDWDMWLRYSAAGGRTGLCREPLTRYRWHASSMTHSRQNQRMACQGRRRALERALASPRGRELPQSVVRRAEADMWKCSAWFAAPTQTGLAIAWYARAACRAPSDVSIYKELLKCFLGRHRQR